MKNIVYYLNLYEISDNEVMIVLLQWEDTKNLVRQQYLVVTLLLSVLLVYVTVQQIITTRQMTIPAMHVGVNNYS